MQSTMQKPEGREENRMEVKRETSELCGRLAKVSEEVEAIIKEYRSDYATQDYWDNFQETLANVSAQIYMQRIVLQNAAIRERRAF